ncbi:MAG: hypothetical protein ACRC0Y_04910 [Fusobacteriaceae bacterium]
MPIRHLTLREPTYVPSYNTLDTNLVAGVSSEINRQGMAAMDQSSALFQNLQENVINTIGNLDQQHQFDAQDIVNQSRESIDQIFEERGARHAMPAIQREARNLTQSLQPYQTRAGQLQQLREKIDESEAPAEYKNYYATYLSEQNQRPIEEQIQMDEYYSVLENYVEPMEWAKDMKSLMGNPGASTIDGEGNLASPESQYWIKRAGKSALELRSDIVGAALGNTQMRRQFEFEAKMLAESGHDIFKQFIVEDEETGEMKFDPTAKEVYDVVDGKEDEETMELNPVQALAIQTFNPYASIMANDSAQIERNKFFGEDDNNTLGTPGGRNVDSIPTSVYSNTNEWAKGIVNQVKQLNSSLQTSKREATNRFKVDGFDLKVRQDGEIDEFVYQIDGNDYSYEEAMEYVEDNQSLKTYLEAIHLEKQATKNVIARNELNIVNYKNRAQNELLKDENLAPFADSIIFDWETGELTIDGDKFADIVESTDHRLDLDKIPIPATEIERLGLRDMQPGEFRHIIYTTTPGPGRGKSTQRKAVVTTDSRGRFYEDSSGINDSIFSTIDNLNDQLMQTEIAQFQEVPAIVFDTEKDRRVIDRFKDIPTSVMEGRITDPSGNLIKFEDLDKMAYSLSPWSIGLDYEGNAVAHVRITDSDNNAVGEGYFSGDYINSNIESILGTSDHQEILMHRQFANLFPHISSGQDDYMMPESIKKQFHLNHLIDTDLKIYTNTNMEGSAREKSYIVEIGDKEEIRSFRAFEQILPYLLEYDKKSEEEPEI